MTVLDRLAALDFERQAAAEAFAWRWQNGRRAWFMYERSVFRSRFIRRYRR